MNKVLFTLSIT